MRPRLTVDLRGNRCAVGLLTVANDTPRWQPQDILDVYVTPENSDPAHEADLSFFGEPDMDKWLPMRRSLLEGLPKTYRRLDALLDRPLSEIKPLLKTTLWPLLRNPLRKWREDPIPLLILVDREEVRGMLHDVLSKGGGDLQISLVARRWGAMGGFALLGLNDNSLSANNGHWYCRIHDPAEPRPAEHRRYTWRKSRFEFKEVKPERIPATEVLTWRSARELERLGAALFAVYWQEKLGSILDEEIHA